MITKKKIIEQKLRSPFQWLGKIQVFNSGYFQEIMWRKIKPMWENVCKSWKYPSKLLCMCYEVSISQQENYGTCSIVLNGNYKVIYIVSR